MFNRNRLINILMFQFRSSSCFKKFRFASNGFDLHRIIDFEQILVSQVFMW